MTVSNFDASAIDWQPFGEFPHFAFFIMNVDMEQRIADVIFRFDAGRQIVSHRHTSLNHTFVVQGEHRIYEHDGSLRKRVRPASTRSRRRARRRIAKAAAMRTPSCCSACARGPVNCCMKS